MCHARRGSSAKRSLWSTNSPRIVSRSRASDGEPGSAAAEATIATTTERPSARPNDTSTEDRRHVAGTVRGRLLPPSSASRRRDFGPGLVPPGEGARRLRARARSWFRQTHVSGEDESRWLERAQRSGGAGARSVTTPTGRLPIAPCPTARRDGRAAYCRGPPVCVSSVFPRRSSAAAAGTRTSRSPRPAPSSGTWTARLARSVRPTSPRRTSAPRSRRVPALGGEDPAAIPTAAFPRRPRPSARSPRIAAPRRARLLPRHRSRPAPETLLRALLALLARIAKPVDLDSLASEIAATHPRSRGTTWPGSRLRGGRQGGSAG